MSKATRFLFISFFAFIIIVIGNYVIIAQNTTTGDWKAEYKLEKPDKIYLSFSRKSESGRNQTGSKYDLSDLQGLSANQVTGTSSNVRFSIVREAGNIDCEGTFQNGKGAGTFRFTPNLQFISAMKSRGFDFEKTSRGDTNIENKLFAAAILNVTTALADDLLSADFGKLDVDDLFKAVIFKIDGNFAREMKETGFQNLKFDDLVKARIFKIDAEFVRDVASKGFNNVPFESLVKMRIFKITPEFIQEIRAEGFTDIEIEDLVKMRIFKIDAEFIRKARTEGVPMEVEKLVQKRIGVWIKN
jgi:hypothetical protein